MRSKADICGYNRKAFMRQVNNNAERFGDDFRFRLTRNEVEELRRNFYAANISPMSRSLPYAYTERGVYMLMTVLRGDLAINQSKALIRLFKRLKDYALEGRDFVGRGGFGQLPERVSTVEDGLARVERKVDGIVAGMADAVRRRSIMGSQELRPLAIEAH